MRFKPGEGGRPKGVKNKSTRAADEAFEAVFEALQTKDTTSLEGWARENLTDFYKLFARKLTTTAESTNHNVTETVSEEQARREAEAFLESQRLAAQRVVESKPDPVHVTDAAGLSARAAAPPNRGRARAR